MDGLRTTCVLKPPPVDKHPGVTTTSRDPNVMDPGRECNLFRSASCYGTGDLFRGQSATREGWISLVIPAPNVHKAGSGPSYDLTTCQEIGTINDCPGKTCCDPKEFKSRIRITKSRGSPSGLMPWAIDHKFSPGCTTTMLVADPCELPAASADPLPKSTQTKRASSVNVSPSTTRPRAVSTIEALFRGATWKELCAVLAAVFMGEAFRLFELMYDL